MEKVYTICDCFSVCTSISVCNQIHVRWRIRYWNAGKFEFCNDYSGQSWFDEGMDNNLKNNLKKNGIKFCIKIKEITSEIMLQLAISATIFLVICFVLNVWTIISYRKYRSRVASVTIYQSIEMKLTTYTIITLIGHILLDVHLVSLDKNNSDHLLINFVSI